MAAACLLTTLVLSACGSKAMEQTIFSRIDTQDMEKLAKSKKDFYIFYEDVQNITRRAADYQAAYSSITYKELYEYESKYYLNSSFRAEEERKAGAAFDAEYDRDYGKQGQRKEKALDVPAAGNGFAGGRTTADSGFCLRLHAPVSSRRSRSSVRQSSRSGR